MQEKISSWRDFFYNPTIKTLLLQKKSLILDSQDKHNWTRITYDYNYVSLSMYIHRERGGAIEDKEIIIIIIEVKRVGITRLKSEEKWCLSWRAEQWVSWGYLVRRMETLERSRESFDMEQHPFVSGYHVCLCYIFFYLYLLYDLPESWWPHVFLVYTVKLFESVAHLS